MDCRDAWVDDFGQRTELEAKIPSAKSDDVAIFVDSIAVSRFAKDRSIGTRSTQAIA